MTAIRGIPASWGEGLTRTLHNVDRLGLATPSELMRGEENIEVTGIVYRVSLTIL